MSSTSSELSTAPPKTKRELVPLLSQILLATSVVIMFVLPFILSSFWTGRITAWIPLAVAALGVNLLTGYNGQISVGHGALYGVGAYTAAFTVNAGWPFLGAIAFASVMAFAVGIVIGLPALRIKGLYLALVTLAVGMIFPQIVEQFGEQTGGTTGLAITSPQANRRTGTLTEKPVKFEAPGWTGLDSAQWEYLFFLVIAVVCFIIVRNVIKSRMGRSIVAVRDNEVAAEVSGVNVASVKVFTFGLSAALAGVGGALLALSNARVASGTFALTISIYFLVAVVVGGPASIVGPAIGAITYGLFNDVIAPEFLPESAKASTPLILGALLVLLMLLAPGGIVGIMRRTGARISAYQQKSAMSSTPSTPEPTH